MALAGAPRTPEGGSRTPRGGNCLCWPPSARGAQSEQQRLFTENHRGLQTFQRLIVTSAPCEMRKFPPALLGGRRAGTRVGSFRSGPPLSIVVCTSQIFICIFFKCYFSQSKRLLHVTHKTTYEYNICVQFLGV